MLRVLPLTVSTVTRTLVVTCAGNATTTAEPSLATDPTLTVDPSEKLNRADSTWSSEFGRSCSTTRPKVTGSAKST